MTLRPFHQASWNEPMLRRPTEALATRYMRTLFPMLDALPFVERYAWFTGRLAPDPHFSSLLGPSGQLTSLGSLYLSLPH